MTRETVLITGASSGIGLELARLFAADGSDLVLVARRADKLAALAEELTETYGVLVRVLTKDLADPVGPREAVEELNRDGVAIDVLVNNAGFGLAGKFAELDAQRQLDMVQVNVVAATFLARALLPGMLERGRGGVLNVASTAAFQPGPNMAIYFATKAFVLSLSEALSEEVRGRGVNVCCLAPGPTATGFAAAAEMENSRLFSLGTLSAEAVARAGYRGLRRGKTLVVPGVANKLVVFTERFLPRVVVRKIAAKLPE